MPRLLVKKRDGSTEPFRLGKIVRVLVAAGLPRSRAVSLARQTAVWAKALGKNPVSSLDIRDEVLTGLEGVNAPVANLYRWYQKSKDLAPSKLIPSVSANPRHHQPASASAATRPPRQNRTRTS